jgi:ABC-2 type transport system permease protein
MVAFLALWSATISTGADRNGFSRQSLLTYVLLAFALDGLLSFRTESTIANSVRTGDVVSDLLKPLDHQAMHFADALGMVLVEGLWLMIITAVLGFLWIDMIYPTDAATIAAFLFSVCLALIIKFDLAYLTGVAAFWLTDVRGLIVTRSTLAGILGGAYFPLEFLPDTVRRVLDLLPFAGTTAVPARIFTGQIAGSAIGLALARQLLWAVAMWLAARFVWKKALRKVTIHGG